MDSSTDVLEELKKHADAETAGRSFRFFKSGPGEYAEGDRFLGVRVPEQRKIARRFRSLPLDEVEQLIRSPYHEVRLTALLILVYQYQKSDPGHRDDIFRFYTAHLDRVNNWDLVDSSAKYIVGHYLFELDRSILFELARSASLWRRRVAVLATFYFIDRGDFDTTFKLSDKLLHDEEDLIHKAVGWMLREIGKQDKARLEEFLKTRYKAMPRTMLRYAIEKFSKKERRVYLKGEV